MYEIDGNKLNIILEKWNILIVLDACRFDFFKEVYRDFFDKGDLSKAISPATGTSEWLQKIFKKEIFDDMVYLSSNPQIRKKMSKDNSISADDRFFKIIDVWKNGWNDKTGTVHPKEMNKAFHKAYLRWPNKRFVLHYLQPHAPYICLGDNPRNPDMKKQVFYFSKETSNIINKTQKILFKRRWGIPWKIGKAFDIEPQRPIGKVWYKYGNEGLRNAYRENLRIALKYVKHLTESISANWIITADHGERLGEKLKYSHGGPRDKEVIEVPYFKLKT